MVDEGIAELMRAIWARGWVTYDATQDDGTGRVVLRFPTVIEAQDFLDAVADPDDDSGLYHRIMGDLPEGEGPDRQASWWRYTATPEDWAVSETADDQTGVVLRRADQQPQIVMTLVVSLPPDDVPLLVERLSGA